MTCQVQLYMGRYSITTHRQHTILPTKITPVQNKVVRNYDRVRGLYFLAVSFAANIYIR